VYVFHLFTTCTVVIVILISEDLKKSEFIELWAEFIESWLESVESWLGNYYEQIND